MLIVSKKSQKIVYTGLISLIFINKYLNIGNNKLIFALRNININIVYVL